jgi:hypothetical protein
MPNGFNIVSVRIKEKGAEVVRMIRALARCAVVTATCCEPCVMEPSHRFLIIGLKREMDFADRPL